MGSKMILKARPASLGLPQQVLGYRSSSYIDRIANWVRDYQPIIRLGTEEARYSCRGNRGVRSDRNCTRARAKSPFWSQCQGAVLQSRQASADITLIKWKFLD